MPQAASSRHLAAIRTAALRIYLPV